MHRKFYGDRPRRTPPSGALNAEGWPNIAILDLSKAISRKRCKIGGKLVLITNRKSYMSFRLVAWPSTTWTVLSGPVRETLF